MKLRASDLLLCIIITISCEKEPKEAESVKQEPALQMSATGQLGQSNEPHSKLAVEDLQEGKGEEVKQNQTLKVSYKAFFESGVLFDSTEKRGKDFTFTLGEGTVIKGWEIGLKGMKVGSLRRLTIPPHLAYGEKGISGLVPPGSTLIFEVKLLAIVDT